MRLPNRLADQAWNITAIYSVIVLAVVVLANSSVISAVAEKPLPQLPPLTASDELAMLIQNQPAAEPAGEAWSSRLYAPTQVTKIGDKWFIVDCWQHRVIWSTSLTQPIDKWQVVDDNLIEPHSLAYGAGYYAVEDTGRGKANFYRFDESNQRFVLSQSLQLGGRPHRTVFDPTTNSFLVLSSLSQTLHRVSVGVQGPVLAASSSLGFLAGAYTRSFTLLDEKRLLFISEGGFVSLAARQGDDYQLQQYYQLPPAFLSGNDIFYTGRNFVVTATGKPGALGVAGSLQDLPQLKNIGAEWGYANSRPYYVSRYGEYLIIPRIGAANSVDVFRFDNQGRLQRLTVMHSFAAPSASTLRRSTQTAI